MNQSDKTKSDQIKKLKSNMDATFDDAEKELKKLLDEARQLAKDAQTKQE